MSVIISPEDTKLFEQNGFTKEQVGATINHYREMGLSDDDIQNKMNDRLNGWKNTDTIQNGEQVKPFELGTQTFDWDNAQEAIKKDPGQATRDMLKDANRRGDVITNAQKGFVQGLSKLGTGLGKNITNKYLRPLFGKEPLSDEELDKAYGWLDDKPQGFTGNLSAFVGNIAPYLALPELKVAQGSEFLPTLANSTATGAYQGATIGGLNSLANEGDLSGVGSGAALGSVLGAWVPSATKLLEVGAKPIGAATKWLTSKTTGLTPKTIDRAIQADSKALDLNEDTAQQLLGNTVERVRSAYNNLLNKAGKKVRNEVDKLNQLDTRFNTQELKDDIKNIYDQYQRDTVNRARDYAGDLEQELYQKLDNAQSGSQSSILDELGLTPAQNKRFTNNSPVKENEAYDILATATGKDRNWIKSRINNLNSRKGGAVDKQAEKFTSLLEDVEKTNPDYNSLLSDKGYNYYNTAGLDEAGAQDLVNQAYNDIVHRNFTNSSLDPLERAMNKAEDEYIRIMGGVYRNSNNPQAYETASNELLNAIKNLPEEIQNEYFTRFASDSDKIYNALNTVSPTSLQALKEQIGHDMKVKFDMPNSDIKNKILTDVYSIYNKRLGDLSPEIAQANKAYARLKNFEKNQGINQILKGDLNNPDSPQSALSALKNYNNSILKSNVNRNVQDLEEMLINNGYEGFLNDIDDVNAAQNIMNSLQTGRNFLGAQDLQKGISALGLRGARALNRNKVWQNYLDSLGKPIPQWLIPSIYGAGNSIYGVGNQ